MHVYAWAVSTPSRNKFILFFILKLEDGFCFVQSVQHIVSLFLFEFFHGWFFLLLVLLVDAAEAGHVSFEPFQVTIYFLVESYTAQQH